MPTIEEYAGLTKAIGDLTASNNALSKSISGFGTNLTDSLTKSFRQALYGNNANGQNFFSFTKTGSEKRLLVQDDESLKVLKDISSKVESLSNKVNTASAIDAPFIADTRKFYSDVTASLNKIIEKMGGGSNINPNTNGNSWWDILNSRSAVFAGRLALQFLDIVERRWRGNSSSNNPLNPNNINPSSNTNNPFDPVVSRIISSLNTLGDEAEKAAKKVKSSSKDATDELEKETKARKQNNKSVDQWVDNWNKQSQKISEAFGKVINYPLVKDTTTLLSALNESILGVKINFQNLGSQLIGFWKKMTPFGSLMGIIPDAFGKILSYIQMIVNQPIKAEYERAEARINAVSQASDSKINEIMAKYGVSLERALELIYQESVEIKKLPYVYQSGWDRYLNRLKQEQTLIMQTSLPPQMIQGMARVIEKYSDYEKLGISFTSSKTFETGSKLYSGLDSVMEGMGEAYKEVRNTMNASISAVSQQFENNFARYYAITSEDEEELNERNKSMIIALGKLNASVIDANGFLNMLTQQRDKMAGDFFDSEFGKFVIMNTDDPWRFKEAIDSQTAEGLDYAQKALQKGIRENFAGFTPGTTKGEEFYTMAAALGGSQHLDLIRAMLVPDSKGTELRDFLKGQKSPQDRLQMSIDNLAKQDQANFDKTHLFYSATQEKMKELSRYFSASDFVTLFKERFAREKTWGVDIKTWDSFQAVSQVVTTFFGDNFKERLFMFAGQLLQVSQNIFLAVHGMSSIVIKTLDGWISGKSLSQIKQSIAPDVARADLGLKGALKDTTVLASLYTDVLTDAIKKLPEAAKNQKIDPLFRKHMDQALGRQLEFLSLLDDSNPAIQKQIQDNQNFHAKNKLFGAGGGTATGLGIGLTFGGIPGALGGGLLGYGVDQLVDSPLVASAMTAGGMALLPAGIGRLSLLSSTGAKGLAWGKNLLGVGKNVGLAKDVVSASSLFDFGAGSTAAGAGAGTVGSAGAGAGSAGAGAGGAGAAGASVLTSTILPIAGILASIAGSAYVIKTALDPNEKDSFIGSLYRQGNILDFSQTHWYNPASYGANVFYKFNEKIAEKFENTDAGLNADIMKQKFGNLSQEEWLEQKREQNRKNAEAVYAKQGEDNTAKSVKAVTDSSKKATETAVAQGTATRKQIQFANDYLARLGKLSPKIEDAIMPAIIFFNKFNNNLAGQWNTYLAGMIKLLEEQQRAGSTETTATEGKGSGEGFGGYSGGSVFNAPITGNYRENRGNHLHNGIDFGAPGGTPLPATENAIVADVEHNPALGGGYGKLVFLKGLQSGMYIGYAHLSEVNTKIGEKVSAGQMIGRVGNTGHSFGDHLHFMVGTNVGFPASDINSTIDPLAYLSGKNIPVVKGTEKKGIAGLGGLSRLPGFGWLTSSGAKLSSNINSLTKLVSESESAGALDAVRDSWDKGYGKYQLTYLPGSFDNWRPFVDWLGKQPKYSALYEILKGTNSALPSTVRPAMQYLTRHHRNLWEQAQDEYIVKTYLDVLGPQVNNRGIPFRSAALSFSVLQGQQTASNMLKASGALSTPDDTQALVKLYRYALANYSQGGFYTGRYTREAKSLGIYDEVMSGNRKGDGEGRYSGIGYNLTEPFVSPISFIDVASNLLSGDYQGLRPFLPNMIYTGSWMEDKGGTAVTNDALSRIADMQNIADINAVWNSTGLPSMFGDIGPSLPSSQITNDTTKYAMGYTVDHEWGRKHRDWIPLAPEKYGLKSGIDSVGVFDPFMQGLGKKNDFWEKDVEGRMGRLVKKGNAYVWTYEEEKPAPVVSAVSGAVAVPVGVSSSTSEVHELRKIMDASNKRAVEEAKQASQRAAKEEQFQNEMIRLKKQDIEYRKEEASYWGMAKKAVGFVVENVGNALGLNTPPSQLSGTSYYNLPKNNTSQTSNKVNRGLGYGGYGGYGGRR